jgi:hypothetical protein
MVSKPGMPNLLIQDGVSMRKGTGTRFLSKHEGIDWINFQLAAALCRTNQFWAHSLAP